MFVLVPILLLVASCGAPRANPQFGADLRNPIIFVPGIMGSALAAGESKVYGDIGFGVHKAEKLKLPIDVLTREQELALALDSEVLEDIDLGVAFSIPVLSFGVTALGVVKVYRPLLETFESMGMVVRHVTQLNELEHGPRPDQPLRCSAFVFAYDWRLGNDINAARLDGFIKEATELVSASVIAEVSALRDRGLENEALRLEAWAADFKFDVVAHSMGGLIANYCAAYGDHVLDGSGALPEPNKESRIAKIVTFGTPFEGAPVAMANILAGHNAIPTYEFDIEAAGSMPSGYQLMAHGATAEETERSFGAELTNFAAWQKSGLGLLSSFVPGSLDKRVACLQWHLKRASQFHRALQLGITSGACGPLFVVASREHATVVALDFDRDDVANLVWKRRELEASGDSTVPATSACPAWLPSPEVLWVSEPHVRLVRDKKALSMLSEWLPSEPLIK
jgi:pimeloyl-ACP methyl ester carboxylesterase